jgi:murein DD-endopeptidase MepM/ murein hydrolase activator NlpD
MGNGGQNQVNKPPVSSSSTPDDSDTDGSTSSDTGAGDLDSNKPVGGDGEGMILPVAEATLMNDHGFYYNQTLNIYYEHAGVDFAAEEGAQVFAVDDGVVESIYKDDLLLGTEIVLVHADGVKSVYRFVTETEGLQVGAEVARGECIATVAAATGNEYKEGPHLHFEIIKDGQSIDPTVYLTLEEK